MLGGRSCPCSVNFTLYFQPFLDVAPISSFMILPGRVRARVCQAPYQGILEWTRV